MNLQYFFQRSNIEQGSEIPKNLRTQIFSKQKTPVEAVGSDPSVVAELSCEQQAWRPPLSFCNVTAKHFVASRAQISKQEVISPISVCNLISSLVPRSQVKSITFSKVSCSPRASQLPGSPSLALVSRSRTSLTSV